MLRLLHIAVNDRIAQRLCLSKLRGCLVEFSQLGRKMPMLPNIVLHRIAQYLYQTKLLPHHYPQQLLGQVEAIFVLVLEFVAI